MMPSTQCKLRTRRPIFTGSHPGEAGRQNQRSLWHPAPPSPDLPIPKRQCLCRWAGPAQGTEASVTTGCTLPSCSSFHLPSATHPAGPVVGILPDFFQLSPKEGQGQMLGTHWTRPTGQHWFLGGDGAPQLSSCHTLDTARTGETRGTRKTNPLQWSSAVASFCPTP